MCAAAVGVSLFLFTLRVDKQIGFMVPATFLAACNFTTAIHALCVRFSLMNCILVSARRIEKSLTEIGQEELPVKQQDALHNNTEGKIEFRRVYLRYREQLDFVLQDLSFTICSG